MHSWCGVPAGQNETDSRRVCSECNMHVHNTAEDLMLHQAETTPNSAAPNCCTDERLSSSRRQNIQSLLTPRTPISRTKGPRFSVRQKGEVAQFIKDKVPYSIIASKYLISERTYTNISKHREELIRQAASIGNIGNRKSRKAGARCLPRNRSQSSNIPRGCESSETLCNERDHTGKSFVHFETINCPLHPTLKRWNGCRNVLHQSIALRILYRKTTSRALFVMEKLQVWTRKLAQKP